MRHFWSVWRSALALLAYHHLMGPDWPGHFTKASEDAAARSQALQQARLKAVADVFKGDPDSDADAGKTAFGRRWFRSKPVAPATPAPPGEDAPVPPETAAAAEAGPSRRSWFGWRSRDSQ